MPRQLAGRGLQGDDAVGEQIVARPRLAVIDRRRVADAPVNEIELGIEASGDPRGAATGFPRTVLPGIVTELARSRNGVEAPAQLTGLRIVRGQEPADGELAAMDIGASLWSPVCASRATSLASKVPRNSRLPRMATPLFTRPQQIGSFSGRRRTYRQTSRPVAASRATTLLGGSLTKIVPLATIGVAWMASSLPN